MPQKYRLFITNTVKLQGSHFHLSLQVLLRIAISISQFMLHEHPKTLLHYDLHKLTSRLFTDPSRESDTLSI